MDFQWVGEKAGRIITQSLRKGSSREEIEFDHKKPQLEYRNEIHIYARAKALRWEQIAQKGMDHAHAQRKFDCNWSQPPAKLSAGRRGWYCFVGRGCQRLDSLRKQAQSVIREIPSSPNAPPISFWSTWKILLELPKSQKAIVHWRKTLHHHHHYFTTKSAIYLVLTQTVLVVAKCNFVTSFLVKPAGGGVYSNTWLQRASAFNDHFFVHGEFRTKTTVFVCLSDSEQKLHLHYFAALFTRPGEGHKRCPLWYISGELACRAAKWTLRCNEQWVCYFVNTIPDWKSGIKAAVSMAWHLHLLFLSTRVYSSHALRLKLL